MSEHEQKTLQEWLDTRLMGVYQLASYSGVSSVTIYAILAGKTTAPQLKTVLKLADALRVEPGQVIEFLPRTERRRIRRQPEPVHAQELDNREPGLDRFQSHVRPLGDWMVTQGVSYSDIARDTGLSVATVQRAVEGQTRPTRKTSMKICRALNLHINQVMEFVFSLRFHSYLPISIRKVGGHYIIRLDHLDRMPLEDLYAIVRLPSSDIDRVLEHARVDVTSNGYISKEAITHFFPNAEFFRMPYPDDAPRRLRAPTPKVERDASEREELLARIGQQKEWEGSLFSADYPEEDDSFFEEES